MLDFLRGSVRPVLAYVFMGVFAVITLLAFLGYGDAELGEKVVIAFLAVTALIAGIYFQSRNKTNGQ